MHSPTPRPPLGIGCFCDTAKTVFSRRRPGLLDERIKPLLTDLDKPCYPSGHSAQSMLMALVLAELAPDKKAALVERAHEIGWGRIVAGVHNPSDNVAGRTLGQTIALDVLANPEFRRELTKAKAEVQAKRTSQVSRKHPPAVLSVVEQEI